MTKSQVRDRLNKKLKQLVEMLGELKYEIIEHPIIEDLESVDNVMTKKLVIKLMRTKNFIWFGCDKDAYIELAEDYEDYDFDELVDELGDELFSAKTTWINLESLVDESSDYEDSCADDYFDIRLIQYGVLTNQKIPKIDLYDYDKLDALSDFIEELLLSNEELTYLKNIDVLLSKKKFFL